MFCISFEEKTDLQKKGSVIVNGKFRDMFSGKTDLKVEEVSL